MSHICSASSSDCSGAGRQKSTTIVVPPDKGRARAALEIVGRIGAHEGHFEMGVRIDAAGHDVAAGGVELVIAMQVLADGDDLAVLDQHVGLPGAVGGDDGAVLDDLGHFFSSPIVAALLCERFGLVQIMYGPPLRARTRKRPSPAGTELERMVSAHNFTPRSPPSPPPHGTARRSRRRPIPWIDFLGLVVADSPSTQGHITIAVGATRLIQQASWPAPETMSRCE